MCQMINNFEQISDSHWLWRHGVLIRLDRDVKLWYQIVKMVETSMISINQYCNYLKQIDELAKQRISNNINENNEYTETGQVKLNFFKQ